VKLLVSVANAGDAAAAIAGGADFIDAKNPQAGALGAVSIAVLREIHAGVAGRRPVTAALGDMTDTAPAAEAAGSFAAAGATLVKLGFAGANVGAIAGLIQAAVAAAGSLECGVVAVAYADLPFADRRARKEFIGRAARGGARGVLFDTADKKGPGLCGILSPDDLAALSVEAHAAGLFLALAGKLTVDDIPIVRAAGADIAGVRGAVCDGGRTGAVVAEKVRQLL